MALAVLPALFTCLCYPPTGILSAHDGLPRHPHCPHASRRSVRSFGSNGHPCGRSAIGCAASVRHTYRGFTWARPFGRPSRSFRLLSFPLSLILAFTMIGFARGSRRPSFNPFGRSVRAQLPPAPAVSGVARWGGVPSRSRRGVPPSPARLAAWPLGAWPARSAPALPVSRWRGRGLAWPWGASRPGARGPLPALRPRASRGVRGRGVPWRPSRRGPRRLAAWRPAHRHPAPGVSLGAPVRGPWRPPWPLAPPLGRCGPSVPPPLGRGGGVASVAFPRWPVGAPVGASRGRGARGLAPGVPGRRGGGWSRCQGVPRPPWGRGVASVVNEL